MDGSDTRRSSSVSGSGSKAVVALRAKAPARRASSRSSNAPLRAAAAVALGDCPTVGKDKPVGFFVYGTLRPDDDSGASWTAEFQQGMVATPATLPGASLYIDGSYPAVNFERTSCSVLGILLTPEKDKKNTLAAKLMDADRIEGYPDLYERAICMVDTELGQRFAYVYHRSGRTDRESCQRILDGD